MRTILVLMDTLRRDVLSCYNLQSPVVTPNLDAFARESCVFDEHWVGSAPCMPARRDILTGRLNFLERGWGPIEPFDVTLPQVLREHGYFCHITTDHCHYLRTGGEGYLQQFNTWDYHRGQEGDPWVSAIDDPSNMPRDYYGRVRRQYQLNRTQWPEEAQMPSPLTFQSACDWLDRNGQAEDYFLMVEAFDPHEPFDVPDEYLSLYDGPELDRDYYEIPCYARQSESDVTDDAVAYLRRRYHALVTMTDRWFGRLMDKVRELGIWDDVLLVATTDHGYFLGERDFLGKNFMPLYNELAHLPLLVRFPGGARAGRHAQQLTQNIDLMPTVLDFAGIEIPDDVAGVSLKPLATDADAPTKDYALFGYHAMDVNITDGRYVYFRAPVPGNQPCFEYAAMPTTIRRVLGTDNPGAIECGRFLPRTDYPVFKVPVTKPGIIDQSDDPLREVSKTRLFDLAVDYGELDDLAGGNDPAEDRMVGLLLRALDENDAPPEQYERLGLAAARSACQSDARP
ncbi:sulfatase [Olsenella sp. YH-ols2217]|uniref:Sulfatase n=1 Tax=Kribbibacterium absianum TaxID=3044210 RepID=A0ABT6ZKE5_9ACTN|nr:MULTISPECIES: sulfatase [unclassified Olsenella]MDJ1122526.1 sulfatase [Olsenella sp. YH-ols2216]MDJ1129514.1 sulfatase [Olsenella sp. YH-ols2217]